MIASNIGGEFEYSLIDLETGYLKNNAKTILDDPRNDGSIVKEGTDAQVEINSQPANTISELEKDVKKRILLLEEICQDHASFPIPASEYGAGKGKLRGMSDPVKNRGPIYLALLGKNALEELRAYSGIHLHLSQIPGRELEQAHLLQALDPLSYALTSTSPISYQGVNSLNCHRINSFRNNVFKEFPLHAKLQPYPSALNEVDAQDTIRWEQWRDALEKGSPSLEGYLNLFKPENTGYAPIRKRDQISPTGTFEVRSFDSAPLDVALAVFAFYKGLHDNLLSNQRPIKIAEKNQPPSFNKEEIVLPNYDTLQHLETEAIKKGMKSIPIKEYLTHLLPYAKEGLPPKDKPYLHKVKEMLDQSTNPADEIMAYMRQQGYHGHHFTPQQSAQANLFMREKHLSSLGLN